MRFTPIDFAQWNRTEHYQHYINQVPCSYSAFVELDNAPLKGQRLYPAMLWLLTGIVNQMAEFRTGLRPEGTGIYDEMHPAYTLFNPEKKNFTCVWTQYQSDYCDFLQAYEEDAARHAHSTRFIAK